MHHALLVHELFEPICRLSSKPTLASLAQTCRSFEEAALDVLWDHLYSPDQLVPLWPDEIWVESFDQESSEGRVELCYPPSFEHWQRLRKYTSRVISADFSHTGLGYQHTVARLRRMISLQPPEDMSPIFPKLKKISAYPYTENLFIIPMYKFPWVDGPSLTQFRMSLASLEEEEEEVAPFVGLLGNLYPNMRRAVFEMDNLLGRSREGRRLLAENLSRAVLGWKDLEHGSFNTDDLSACAYEHLSRLESLTSLCLNISLDADLELYHADNASTPFPALTELELAAYNIEMLVEWMGSHRRSLSSLTCKVTNTLFETPDVHTLCHSAATCFDHSTLQTIFLHYDDRRDSFVPLNSLQPLFAFTQLRSVILSPFGSILLDDDDLRQLASSWPLLEVLDISRDVRMTDTDSDPEYLPAPLPTFHGFFDLLEKCRRLRELCIVIDTRDSVWIDPHNIPVNCNMSKLMLGMSPVDDPGRVAGVLRAVFPVLARVETKNWIAGSISIPKWRIVEEVVGVWKAVNDHLAALPPMVDGGAGERRIGSG